MRIAARILGLGLLAVVALVGCAGASTAPSASPTASPQPVAINIKGFAFNPKTIEVTRGTTVTWTNQDTVPHTVTTGVAPPTFPPLPSGSSPTPFPSLSSGDGKVVSGRIEPTKTFSFTFNDAGTFVYFCSVHPAMGATISVK
jgi:plastocyanin